MSNFADKHKDSTHATLFEAWFDLQSPRIQKRASIWLLVAADYHMTGNTLPETALEMGAATLWAFAMKDMKQFMNVLKG